MSASRGDTVDGLEAEVDEVVLGFHAVCFPALRALDILVGL